jgi:hypothetical protein
MDAEQRDTFRRTVRQGARLATTEGAALGTCIMVDVSATGARLVLDKPDPLPKRFVLLLSHNGNLRRLCSVAWQSETTVGVQFISG